MDTGDGRGGDAASPDPPAPRRTLAIVGRPNVGKSTLFNRITRSRQALVADEPGLTRDPKVGIGRVGDAGYIVVDTGGIDDASADPLSARVAEQALAVARDCDAVALVVDARAGLTAADEQLAASLRRDGIDAVLAVNKAEGLDPDLACAEFAALGLGRVHALSAAHGDGVGAFVDAVTEGWPPPEKSGTEPGDRVLMAVLGRPNVGKSTLVNRMLGEERMITFDEPGTTRDAVDTDFERDGRAYTIIDTAGLRRRSRAQGVAEKFSAVQTLQALERCHVAVLVIDARESVTDQDLSLLGLALDSGRALVIAVNKWDGLDAEQRERVRRDLDRRLRFAEFAELRFVSALHGTGVGELFPLILAAWRSAFVAPKTGALTAILERAVADHEPPLVRGRRIRLRYAHLGGRNPPRIVVHGNQVKDLPGSYARYLSNYFRDALGLVGTPVSLEFRQGDNPFAGRRNKLTKRQAAKRRRLMSHAKRRK